jgi:penicillin amidase
MQVGHANTVDYYIEDPSDVFLHRTEIIKVLGEDDVALPIYRTSHGPVISPMPYDPATYDPASDGPIIAWKYAHWGHEFDALDAFLGLNRAKSMDSFEEAIEDVPVSQHFCYVDRDGNIGYWMSGRDPLRPAGEWRFPQGFMGAPLEWDSEILIARSTDRNTSQGFYSGWNNKSNPSYDASYGPFHRAHVIHDYLSTQDDLTFEDVRDLARNIATTDSFGSGGNPWKFVEDYFTGVVSANPTQERTDALALMAAWDGHFVDGGESAWAWGEDRADAWVLMDAWIREVIRLTFEDELGSGESRYTLFNVLLHGLPGTTINNNYDWFQNLADVGAPQTAEAIILAALDNALADLGARPWGTGARGEIVFNHPVLDVLASGDVHTMPFSSRSTFAHCVEYDSGGPTRIESMFPLGESGNITTGAGWLFTPVFDPNFFGMTDVYDGFEHRPFPLFD